MKKQQKIFYSILLASIFLHVTFFLFKIERNFSQISKQENRIKLKLRSEEFESRANQMAETNKSKDQEKSKDATFFSEQNNNFEKQTKASENGKFQNAGLGKKDANAEKVAKIQPAMEAQKKVTKKKGDISFKDFSFSPTTTKIAQKLIAQKESQVRKGLENGDKLISGLARTNDYLEHIPLGDMTSLNTTEHVYYGFYYRIKQQLEQHWGASLKEKMEKVYKRNGRFPASDKYITSIKVMLDEKGKIVDIIIKGSSGVEELDQAAIESFNKAGPFPNPPKGMIINGRAAIEWGFAVTNS